MDGGRKKERCSVNGLQSGNDEYADIWRVTDNFFLEKVKKSESNRLMTVLLMSRRV